MLRSCMQAYENALKFAALWAVVSLAHGQANDPPATPSFTPTTASAPAPAESHWRLGAAFGYGQRSNPLIQSEDIPVLVDLDIAWFGRRWFFDNGDVGFTLSDGDRATTSLVARLNSDRVFFGKTNTRYVNLAYAGNGQTAGMVDASGEPVTEPVEVQPPDRDYAVELGVESLIDGNWGAVTLRAFHDVSNTHEGYELGAYYSWRWIAGRVSLSPSVGFAYKSAALNDYYWGVHADEASPALPEYHAGDGFNLEGGLVANYHITRHLRFALSVNYERLSDEIASSPLAEEDHVFAYFSGLAWTF